MEHLIGQPAAGAKETAAPTGGDLIKDTTTRDFTADVIEASRRVPVLVDFWAPWCGPCKQLTPIIENAVKAARGRVRLVKMNIDDHPAIAGQLGIQSIPAVIAFKDGQPVDGFMGAVPESQIAAFIERLAGPGGASDGVAEALEAAEEALAAGETQTAGQIFAQILQREPENVAALAGLAKALIKAGQMEEARRALDSIPTAKWADPAVAGARAALELAESAGSLADVAALEARIGANADDHEARFDLALALNAGGERERALDHLIEIVRRERDWNDDAARKQLIQFFEAWGPKDPLTATGRRRLSSALFS